MATLREEMVRCANAAADYNIREHGRNNGRAVKAILGHAGGQAGQPWCCAFADMIYEVACVLANAPALLDPGLSCSVFIAQGKKHGRVFTDVDDVQPGDFMVLRGGPTGFKHIGIVISAVDGVVRTVEGNTNEAGSAEGDGVYRKVRDSRGIPMVFVRAA